MVGFPPKSSIKKNGFPLFSPSILVVPLVVETPISPYYPHVHTVHTSLQGNVHFCSLLLAKDSDVVVPSNGVSGSFVHCPEWCSAQRDTRKNEKSRDVEVEFLVPFWLTEAVTTVVCSPKCDHYKVTCPFFLKLEKSLEKEKIQPTVSAAKRCSLTRSGPTNGTWKPCPAIWGKVFWV